MAYLEVSGASLYYETVGDGEMFLCITGAIGNLEPFKGLAEYLKDRFKVVMYDRRGFSRSYLSATEAQDYDHRLQTDADDAAHLIRHLSTDGIATVLGSSSGAIVALQLLVQHPDVVRILLPHEPPAHNLLPDFEEIAAGSQQLYGLYRQSGMAPALRVFAQAVKLDEHETPFLLQAFDPRSGPYVFSNAQYWFEREILYYPAHKFDVKDFEAHKEKLILALGEWTDKEAGHHRPNLVLSEKLRLDPVYLPGAHLGFASHPQQFASKLIEALKAKDQYFAKI